MDWVLPATVINIPLYAIKNICDFSDELKILIEFAVIFSNEYNKNYTPHLLS